MTTRNRHSFDLVDRPGLGDLDRADESDAVVSLVRAADLDLAVDLAAAQRKRRVRDRLVAAREGEDWQAAVAGA